MSWKNHWSGSDMSWEVGSGSGQYQTDERQISVKEMRLKMFHKEFWDLRNIILKSSQISGKNTEKGKQSSPYRIRETGVILSLWKEYRKQDTKKEYGNRETGIIVSCRNSCCWKIYFLNSAGNNQWQSAPQKCISYNSLIKKIVLFLIYVKIRRYHIVLGQKQPYWLLCP